MSETAAVPMVYMHQNTLLQHLDHSPSQGKPSSCLLYVQAEGTETAKLFF
jgi:hypothetical protein